MGERRGFREKNLGVLLKRRGAQKKACAAYQRAIDSGQPEYSPVAAFNLGVLLNRQGEYAEARDA